MFGFLFLLFLALIGIGLIVAAAVMKSPEDQRRMQVPRWPFAACGAFLILVAFFSILATMYTTVNTSDEGIVTAFGHTQGGDLGPGVHFVAPWEDVTTWDDSVQYVSFAGTHNNKTNTGCLVVRIAGQQAACLDVNIWWRDNPAASDSQFRLYRTFPRVASAFFSRGVIVQYFNNRFERFDPVALASQTAAGQQGGQDVSALTALVTSDLRKAYAGNAYIIRMTTSSPSYSAEVETALNRVVTAKANTNVALQNEQTAVDQALAVKALNAQKPTSATILQLCLTTTQNIIQAGGKLPAAWTCTGSGSGVIVNSGG